MTLRGSFPRFPRRLTMPVVLVLPLLLAFSAQPIPARQSGGNVLKIGTSGSLGGEQAGAKNSSNMDMLEGFIKEETGLKSDMVRTKGWRDLADKLTNGTVQVGVFQGYEFAWARHSHPELRPLALAVNVHPYLTVYAIVRHDNAVRDSAGLEGKSVSTAGTDQGYLRIYLEERVRALGKEPQGFFSKITSPQSAEDGLDDVVDGVVGATVVDRAALEAYRQRKPGRFKQLRELAHSPALPPPLVAYKEGALDQATLRRFRDGLLNANRKEKGQTMLSQFHLTGFIVPPADIDKVLTATAKDFPPTLIANK